MGLSIVSIITIIICSSALNDDECYCYSIKYSATRTDLECGSIYKTFPGAVLENSTVNSLFIGFIIVAAVGAIKGVILFMATRYSALILLYRLMLVALILACLAMGIASTVITQSEGLAKCLLTKDTTAGETDSFMLVDRFNFVHVASICCFVGFVCMTIYLLMIIFLVKRGTQQ